MFGLSNHGLDTYVIHLDQSEPSGGLHKCSKPWLESQNMSCQTAPQLPAEGLDIPWLDHLISPQNTSRNSLALHRGIEPKSQPVSAGVAAYTGSTAGNFTTLVRKALSSGFRWA